jgi:acyl-CoA synthetase (AMP-forming)/AMP-acid ligase II
VRITGNSALQELFDASGTAELIAHGVKYTATALHHGANDWSRALRRAGITRGDRVICSLPNGAAFAQLLVASLADGITLAPVPPDEDVVPLLDALDARIAIAPDVTHPHVSDAAPTGGPPRGPMVPRKSTARTDTIAFLLRTSGTAGQPRWIALSETGVLAVLQSHLPLLGIDGGSALCALAWSHAFGLVLGLMPALLRARRIVAVSDPERTPDALIATARAQQVTHMSMVPLLASRFGESEDGRALLQSLTGGLVGGAPIDGTLAALLAATRLRVGYGQTEASPGIMLGHPGEFRAMLIGRPVGCEVRIETDGVLAFRGPNACEGIWQDGALQSLAPDRWQRTGDVVSVEGGVYSFVGRTATSFKLANGRLVQTPELEASLRHRIPRITDVVLTTVSGGAIDVLYSTHDAAPVSEAEIRQVFGGLSVYVRSVTPVGIGAWVRTPKGDIDRQQLPSPR